jgi:phage tail sheath gpL-like
MIVIGDNDQTIINKLETHCQTAEDDEKWRIGFVGHNPDDTTTQLKAVASATDSKFITQIACTPSLSGVKVHSSLLAAAIAGKFSARERPIINPDGEIIKGFDGVSSETSWTTTQQQDLLSGGVTPLVIKFGEIEIVRWVATYLTDPLTALPSTLYQDGAEYEVTRYIAQQLTVLIAANFKQKANTSTVRNSIANFIDEQLKTWQSAGILDEDAFVPTIVIVDPLDVHGVIETVSFKPVAPLHFHTITLKRIL